MDALTPIRQDEKSRRSANFTLVNPSFSELQKPLSYQERFLLLIHNAGAFGGTQINYYRH